jgi:hypothetical protein
MEVFQDVKCMYVYWLKMNIVVIGWLFWVKKISVYSVVFSFHYSVYHFETCPFLTQPYCCLQSFYNL